MPEPEEDYWPTDIGETPISTPLSIMRAQAGLLGQKTNQQLTANVVTVGLPPNNFAQSFQLTSPALGGYKYELFQLRHPITLYPGTLVWEGHHARPINNEEELKKALREILQSEQTKKIIDALLAQVVR